jgi:hypothetical protein
MYIEFLRCVYIQLVNEYSVNGNGIVLILRFKAML